jgi:HSP20 family protein
MSLMRFDPERELLSLRDAMNRLMEESFVLPSMIGEMRGSGRAWGLALDMYETNDQLVVKASMPGVKPENLDIRTSSRAAITSASAATGRSPARWLCPSRFRTTRSRPTLRMGY